MANERRRREGNGVWAGSRLPIMYFSVVTHVGNQLNKILVSYFILQFPETYMYIGKS